MRTLACLSLFAMCLCFAALPASAPQQPAETPLILLPERQPSCVGCQCGCQQGDPCQCDKPREVPEAAPAAINGELVARGHGSGRLRGLLQKARQRFGIFRGGC